MEETMSSTLTREATVTQTIDGAELSRARLRAWHLAGMTDGANFGVQITIPGRDGWYVRGWDLTGWQRDIEIDHPRDYPYGLVDIAIAFNEGAEITPEMIDRIGIKPERIAWEGLTYRLDIPGGVWERRNAVYTCAFGRGYDGAEGKWYVAEGEHWSSQAYGTGRGITWREVSREEYMALVERHGGVETDSGIVMRTQR
jgi:hypothetical protein